MTTTAKLLEQAAAPLNLRPKGSSYSGGFALDWINNPRHETMLKHCPADDSPLAAISLSSLEDMEQSIDVATTAFDRLRKMPAPARGNIVRDLGEALRAKKESLAMLVTLEAGKITSEALGEVQEMIDMADYAVGLSRQLCGLTIASERPDHRLIEQWHPLGPIGVITAFNFPVAVWAWNAMLAIVCGDPVVWKPSPLTPLCSIAVQQIVADVLAKHDVAGASTLAIGGADLGMKLAGDERLPLISATGSTKMGRSVATTVAMRLGRSLLELGGNNALIVAPTASLDLARRAILFAAVGTAGQRCTSLRRLFVHESIEAELVDSLSQSYRSIPIGNPWDDGVLVGPLINQAAVDGFVQAIDEAKREGGEVLVGGTRFNRPGYFVQPTIIRMPTQTAVMQRETFAPILYVVSYQDLDEAIAMQNGVPQGLASSIFTSDLRESERFLSSRGSDCGIANVNIGTSGAEIGGAFGGEKETGGGREAGSDSWKAYMRRQTCTINYGTSLPLAQGVKFDL